MRKPLVLPCSGAAGNAAQGARDVHGVAEARQEALDFRRVAHTVNVIATCGSSSSGDYSSRSRLGVIGGTVDAAVGVAGAGVVAVEALDAEDVAEVGILLAGIRCRRGYVVKARETTGKLGAVGSRTGGVAVERQGIADAVAAALLVVFTGMGLLASCRYSGRCRRKCCRTCCSCGSCSKPGRRRSGWCR